MNLSQIPGHILSFGLKNDQEGVVLGNIASVDVYDGPEYTLSENPLIPAENDFDAMLRASVKEAQNIGEIKHALIAPETFARAILFGLIEKAFETITLAGKRIEFIYEIDGLELLILVGKNIDPTEEGVYCYDEDVITATSIEVGAVEEVITPYSSEVPTIELIANALNLQAIA